MSAENTLPPRLGETALDGGFRRVSSSPAPHALVHARELVTELARDGAPLLRQALTSFESWLWLATLCANEWGAVRATAPTQRLLRRRFLVLGTSPTAVCRAAELPLGAPVHLHGTIRSAIPGRLNTHMSYIWSRSAMTSDNVRLLVEEGHDFLLVDEAGQPARVIATRGYLLNAPALAAGDCVSVFGHTDRVAVEAAPTARQEPVFAVRAGDDAPLLLRRAPQDP